jgi:hypothetical protein
MTDKKVEYGTINDKGQEMVDPTPLYETLGIIPDEPIENRIFRMTSDPLGMQTMSQLAQQHGFETVEEANDFDVGGEDEPPLTGYEWVGMHDEVPVEQEEAKPSETPTEESSDTPQEEDTTGK